MISCPLLENAGAVAIIVAIAVAVAVACCSSSGISISGETWFQRQLQRHQWQQQNEPQ